MTTLRPMSSLDLFKFNMVNLDSFTETFAHNFYLHYLNKWPELSVIAECVDGTLAGYIIGKVEGEGLDWHGHVTALSVAPEFRRGGLARKLMDFLEEVSEKTFHCYFVDLFVRMSNHAAVKFYRKLGYVVWRTVPEYYSGSEGAYDMRKPLSRDVEKLSIRDAEEKED